MAAEGGLIMNMNMAEAGQGKIIECLKAKFSERKIQEVECRREIASLLAESHIDVNVDPLLHTACQQDLLTLCRHVAAGQGRRESHTAPPHTWVLGLGALGITLYMEVYTDQCIPQG